MADRGWWGPWVIVYLPSNDGRRNRKWCEYYRGSDGYCCHYLRQCGGSAQCMVYEPTKRPPEPKQPPIRFPMGSGEPKNPFKGIKRIHIDDIQVPGKEVICPPYAEVEAAREYFKEHKEADRPVIVRCENNRYYLEGNFVQYFVAILLGQTMVSARLGTSEENEFVSRLREVGARLADKHYGEVTVVGSSLTAIKVRTSANWLIDINIESALKEDRLKLL